VNHPMGPPALEICAAADRLALAAPPVAYLGFLLRVLRPGAAGRPRSRTPRCVRLHALTGGAAQISGCIGHTNPGCSRCVRGRKIRRYFSTGVQDFQRSVTNRVRGSPRARGGFCQRFFRRQGAVRISAPRTHTNPSGIRRARVAEIGNRGWGPTENQRPAEDPTPPSGECVSGFDPF
jgi:hypothetical protein